MENNFPKTILKNVFFYTTSYYGHVCQAPKRKLWHLKFLPVHHRKLLYGFRTLNAYLHSLVKGIVHLKMNILSSFIHPQVLLLNTKEDILENVGNHQTIDDSHGLPQYRKDNYGSQWLPSTV